MPSFEDKVDELPKETKKGMKNSKTIGDVSDEVLKNFNYFQLKIPSLEERVSKLEWTRGTSLACYATPKTTKPADENDPQFRNKRNIYLGKLNDKSIKEPKSSTLQYYNIKYDELEKNYC